RRPRKPVPPNTVMVRPFVTTMTKIRQFMSEQSLLGGEEPIRAIERSFAMMKSFTGSVARRVYLPSKYLRINSRLRSLRRILKQSPLRLLGITGDREC